LRWSDWRDGGFFALQTASLSSFRDLDKPVVLALSSLSQAGLYAAAFRIADVAAVPVRALMVATYVRFFQHGIQGPRGSFAFACRIAPVGLALGVLVGIGVAAGSLIAPAILGTNYAGIGRVLLLLAPLPALYALYYIGADTLVSSGHIGFRTSLQLLMPVMDIGICTQLVPSYGATGAALAAILTHLVAVATVWSTAALLARDRSGVRVA
jgi:O-antigen/teichoic acid export membrane protein